MKRRLMRFRRACYGLRAWIPGLRERHRLEIMVGPLGYWNAHQQYQLNLLLRMGLRSSHRLLDLGCGPLQGGIPLIKYLQKGNYIGVDKNPKVIQEAYSQIERHRLGSKAPLLLLSNCFGEEQIGAGTLDFIWASQVLYYFTPAKMNELMVFAKKKLAPGGMLLGDIIGPKHYEYRFPEHGLQLHTPDSMDRVALAHGC